jgi:hypothetical protein
MRKGEDENRRRGEEVRRKRAKGSWQLAVGKKRKGSAEGAISNSHG